MSFRRSCTEIWTTFTGFRRTSTYSWFALTDYSPRQGGIITGNLGTRFPRNLKVSHEIFILNPVHLSWKCESSKRRPKICKKTILYYKKNQSCDRKFISCQRKSFSCHRKFISCHRKFISCHRIKEEHLVPQDIYPVNERISIVTGNKFPMTVNKFPVKGNKYPVRGNKFPLTGNKYPMTGNKFPVAGYTFPVTGKIFPVTRNIFSFIGKMSCDRR